MHSCATKIKKNAEHTRMYTIFRNFLTQYSRRLLSILAQRNHTNNTRNKRCLWLRLSLYCSVCVAISTLHCKQRALKKNVEHTHAHHLSQLSYPIFTSVVVYSRTKCCLFSHDNYYRFKHFVFNIAPILFNNVRK